MIIEELLNASYQEMVDDYMVTYENYYSITKENDKDKYETIKEKNIDLMLHYIIGDENKTKDLTKINNYSSYAKEYLLMVGMSEDNINKLINKLSQ